MRVAGLPHRGVEREGVGIVLRAAAIEHGGEIAAAAEPGSRGDHEARVHMAGRRVRIPRMGDQARRRSQENAGPLGARHLPGEFGREGAVHGRYMHADLLEDAPSQQRHDAAAARRAIGLTRSQGLRMKRPGSPAPGKNGPTACVSIVSKAGAETIAQRSRTSSLARSVSDLIAGSSASAGKLMSEAARKGAARASSFGFRRLQSPFESEGLSLPDRRARRSSGKATGSHPARGCRAPGPVPRQAGVILQHGRLA